jgi:hypothetical protein
MKPHHTSPGIIAQMVSSQLPISDPKSCHMAFVLDKKVLRQVFSEYFAPYSVIVSLSMLYSLLIALLNNK